MRRYIQELKPNAVQRPGGHGRPLPARAHGAHPHLHPRQARPGADPLPAPGPGGHPGGDLRRHRLPGPGAVHRPEVRRLQPGRGRHHAQGDGQEDRRGHARGARSASWRARRRRAIARRRPSRSSTSSSPSPATPSTRPTPSATPRIAYQTAYLKANFPAEYMTAVLMLAERHGAAPPSAWPRPPPSAPAWASASCRRTSTAAQSSSAWSASRTAARPSASGWPTSRTWGPASSRGSSPPGTRAGPSPPSRTSAGG